MKSPFFFRATAFLTLISFVVSESAFASPQILQNLNSSPEIDPVFTKSVSIPSELGAVVSSWGSPASVVLIEDAHGAGEAQRKIQKILQFLDRGRGVSKIFLEGGVGKQDLGLLRFFKDESLNKKAWEFLLKEAEIGGGELYLLEDAMKVPAFGLEEPKVYLSNLKAFRKVLQNQAQSEKFLKGYAGKIKENASKNFPRRLYSFFQEWLKNQEEDSADFLRYFLILQREAKRSLQIDLGKASEQRDWPMLVRLAEIRKREKKLDQAKAENQKARLIEWAKSEGLDPKLILFLEAKKGDEAKDYGYESRRRFWETFYEQASAKGFEFESYPELVIFEGFRILEEEIDAERLMEEMKGLAERIFQKSAETDQQRKILGEARHYLLLKKLFSLEMKREEFEELNTPSPFPLPLQGGEGKGEGDIKSLHREALEFYRLAIQRDEIMVKELLKEKGGKDSSKFSVVLAGGFHTDGITGSLKKRGISYAVIRPQIKQIEGRKQYVASLLGEKVDLDSLQALRNVSTDNVNKNRQDSGVARFVRPGVPSVSQEYRQTHHRKKEYHSDQVSSVSAHSDSSLSFGIAKKPVVQHPSAITIPPMTNFQFVTWLASPPIPNTVAEYFAKSINILPDSYLRVLPLIFSGPVYLASAILFRGQENREKVKELRTPQASTLPGARWTTPQKRFGAGFPKDLMLRRTELRSIIKQLGELRSEGKLEVRSWKLEGNKAQRAPLRTSNVKLSTQKPRSEVRAVYETPVQLTLTQEKISQGVDYLNQAVKLNITRPRGDVWIATREQKEFESALERLATTARNWITQVDPERQTKLGEIYSKLVESVARFNADGGILNIKRYFSEELHTINGILKNYQIGYSQDPTRHDFEFRAKLRSEVRSEKTQQPSPETNLGIPFKLSSSVTLPKNGQAEINIPGSSLTIKLTFESLRDDLNWGLEVLFFVSAPDSIKLRRRPMEKRKAPLKLARPESLTKTFSFEIGGDKSMFFLDKVRNHLFSPIRVEADPVAQTVTLTSQENVFRLNLENSTTPKKTEKLLSFRAPPAADLKKHLLAFLKSLKIDPNDFHLVQIITEQGSPLSLPGLGEKPWQEVLGEVKLKETQKLQVHYSLPKEKLREVKLQIGSNVEIHSPFSKNTAIVTLTDVVEDKRHEKRAHFRVGSKTPWFYISEWRPGMIGLQEKMEALAKLSSTGKSPAGFISSRLRLKQGFNFFYDLSQGVGDFFIIEIEDIDFTNKTVILSGSPAIFHSDSPAAVRSEVREWAKGIGPSAEREESALPYALGPLRGAAASRSEVRGVPYKVAVLLKTLDEAFELGKIETLRRIAALGPRAEVAIPALMEKLTTQDYARYFDQTSRFNYVESELIKTIGALGLAAIPPLIEALRHPNPDVRRDAARALAYMGPSAQSAVPNLIQFIEQEKDYTVKRAGFSALGAIDPEAKEALPTLIDISKGLSKDPYFLKYPGTVEHRERNVIDVLGNTFAGIGSASIPFLREGLKWSWKEQPDFAPARRVVVSAIAQLGPAAAELVPDLIENIKARIKARKELYEIGASIDLLKKMGPAAKAAAPVLKSLLNDKNDLLRWWAQLALKEIQPAPRSEVRTGAALLPSLKGEAGRETEEVPDFLQTSGVGLPASSPRSEVRLPAGKAGAVGISGGRAFLGSGQSPRGSEQFPRRLKPLLPLSFNLPPWMKVLLRRLNLNESISQPLLRRQDASKRESSGKVPLPPFQPVRLQTHSEKTSPANSAAQTLGISFSLLNTILSRFSVAGVLSIFNTYIKKYQYMLRSEVRAVYETPVQLTLTQEKISQGVDYLNQAVKLNITRPRGDVWIATREQKEFESALERLATTARNWITQVDPERQTKLGEIYSKLVESVARFNADGGILNIKRYFSEELHTINGILKNYQIGYSQDPTRHDFEFRAKLRSEVRASEDFFNRFLRRFEDIINLDHSDPGEEHWRVIRQIVNKNVSAQVRDNAQNMLTVIMESAHKFIERLLRDGDFIRSIHQFIEENPGLEDVPNLASTLGTLNTIARALGLPILTDEEINKNFVVGLFSEDPRRRAAAVKFLAEHFREGVTDTPKVLEKLKGLVKDPGIDLQQSSSDLMVDLTAWIRTGAFVALRRNIHKVDFAFLRPYENDYRIDYGAEFGNEIYTDLLLRRLPLQTDQSEIARWSAPMIEINDYVKDAAASSEQPSESQPLDLSILAELIELSRQFGTYTLDLGDAERIIREVIREEISTSRSEVRTEEQGRGKRQEVRENAEIFSSNLSPLPSLLYLRRSEVRRDLLQGIPQALKGLANRDLTGQKVLVRANLNVSIGSGKVKDPVRLEQVKPIAEFLLKKDAVVILIGHNGRFHLDPKKDTRQSLAPVEPVFRNGFPNTPVTFYPQSITDQGLQLSPTDIQGSGIHILENVRFAPDFENSAKDSQERIRFAQGLAALSDGIFIFDAFGDLGSEGASVEDVAKYAKEVYAGPAMVQEFEVLNQVVRGFDALVFGGSKLDKVALLGGLLKDSLSRDGFAIIGSGPSAELNQEKNREFLETLRAGNLERVLTAIDYRDSENTYDIGPQTTALFIQKLESLKPGQTVLLNGTMGFMEHESGRYRQGTKEVWGQLRKLAQRGVRIVVVGGDGSAVSRELGLDQEPNVIFFTGGGVPLKILAGEGLVGLDALRAAASRSEVRKGVFKILLADMPGKVDGIEALAAELNRIYPGQIEILKARGMGKNTAMLWEEIETERPAVIFVRSDTNAFSEKDFIGKLALLRQKYDYHPVILRGGSDTDKQSEAKTANFEVLASGGNEVSVANLFMRFFVGFLQVGMGKYSAFSFGSDFSTGNPSQQWASVFDFGPEDFQKAIEAVKTRGTIPDIQKDFLFSSLFLVKRKPVADYFSHHKIALIGFGKIPKAIAPRLHKFAELVEARAQIMAWSPSLISTEANSKKQDAARLGVIPADKGKILKEANVISIHLPGEAGPYLGEEEFRILAKRAGPIAIFNTARLSGVNHETLRKALQENKELYYFADLDLIQKNTPVQILEDLRNAFPLRVFITPHIAASTFQAAQGVENRTVEALRQLFLAHIRRSQVRAARGVMSYRRDEEIRLTEEVHRNLNSIKKLIEDETVKPWQFFNVTTRGKEIESRVERALKGIQATLEGRYREALSQDKIRLYAPVRREDLKKVADATEHFAMLLTALKEIQTNQLTPRRIEGDRPSQGRGTQRHYSFSWKGKEYHVLVIARWESVPGHQARFELQILKPIEGRRPYRAGPRDDELTSLRIDHSGQEAALDIPEAVRKLSGEMPGRYRYRIKELRSIPRFGEFVKELDRKLSFPANVIRDGVPQTSKKEFDAREVLAGFLGTAETIQNMKTASLAEKVKLAVRYFANFNGPLTRETSQKIVRAVLEQTHSDSNAIWERYNRAFDILSFDTSLFPGFSLKKRTAYLKVVGSKLRFLRETVFDETFLAGRSEVRAEDEKVTSHQWPVTRENLVSGYRLLGTRRVSGVRSEVRTVGGQASQARKIPAERNGKGMGINDRGVSSGIVQWQSTGPQFLKGPEPLSDPALTHSPSLKRGQSANTSPATKDPTVVIIKRILSGIEAIFPKIPPMTTAITNAWKIVKEVLDNASNLFDVQKILMGFIGLGNLIRIMIKSQFNLINIKRLYPMKLGLRTFLEAFPSTEAPPTFADSTSIGIDLIPRNYPRTSSLFPLPSRLNLPRSEVRTNLEIVEKAGAKWRGKFSGEGKPSVLAVEPFDEQAMQPLLEQDINLEWLHPDSETANPDAAPLTQAELLEMVETGEPKRFFLGFTNYEYNREFFEKAYRRLEQAGLLELPRGLILKSAGFSNVDREAAKEFGFWVTNAPGILTQSMTEVNTAAVLWGFYRFRQSFLRPGDSRHGVSLELLFQRKVGEAITDVPPASDSTDIARRNSRLRQLDEIIAQILFGQLLAQVLRFEEKDQYARGKYPKGKWRNTAVGDRAPSHELLGYDEVVKAKKTLGIIGKGEKAAHLIRYAKALGVHRILYYVPQYKRAITHLLQEHPEFQNVEEATKEQVLAESDYVIRTPGGAKRLKSETWPRIVIDPLTLKVAKKTASRRINTEEEILKESLRGKTLGVIGLGNIGERVARVAAVFGMNILAYEPPEIFEKDREGFQQKKVELDHLLRKEGLDELRYVPLEELFEKAHLITVLASAPPDKGTNLVSRQLLKSAKLLRAFISTARGYMVDEDALIEVLKERPDLAAVLDVLKGELQMSKQSDFPIENSPIFSLDQSQVLILGHTGSKEVNTRRTMAEKMVENTTALLAGREPDPRTILVPPAVRSEVRALKLTLGQMKIRQIEKRIEALKGLNDNPHQIGNDGAKDELMFLAGLLKEVDALRKLQPKKAQERVKEAKEIKDSIQHELSKTAENSSGWQPIKNSLDKANQRLLAFQEALSSRSEVRTNQPSAFSAQRSAKASAEGGELTAESSIPRSEVRLPVGEAGEEKVLEQDRFNADAYGRVLVPDHTREQAATTSPRGPKRIAALDSYPVTPLVPPVYPKRQPDEKYADAQTQNKINEFESARVYKTTQHQGADKQREQVYANPLQRVALLGVEKSFHKVSTGEKDGQTVITEFIKYGINDYKSSKIYNNYNILTPSRSEVRTDEERERFEEEVRQTEEWLRTSSFAELMLPFNARQIVEVRSENEEDDDYPVARKAAERMYSMLREAFDRGEQFITFGPYSPTDAVIMKQRGIKMFYLGGWATSAKGSADEMPGADTASYALNRVPLEARSIIRALQKQSRMQRLERSNWPEEKRRLTPVTDYSPYMIADADNGHGSEHQLMNLTRLFVEAGVPGYHYEDQFARKVCGHQGCKGLVSTAKHIVRLTTAAFQLAVMKVPGIIVARTDANEATFLESNEDERDHRFILGATASNIPRYAHVTLAVFKRFHDQGNIKESVAHLKYGLPNKTYEKEFKWLDQQDLLSVIDAAIDEVHKGTKWEKALESVLTKVHAAWAWQAGMKTYGDAVADEMRARIEKGEKFEMTLLEEWRNFVKTASNEEAREKAKGLGIDIVWDWELPRTPEGFYQITGGLEMSIARGLAFAPYAHLVWRESKEPDLLRLPNEQSEDYQFAAAIHAVYPTKMLAQNLSPSFNWDAFNFTEDQIRNYAAELGKLGYVFNFSTYAGHQMDALGAEKLARGFVEEGVLAMVRVQRELRLRESRAQRPQEFVGGNYADTTLMTATGFAASTKSMGGKSTAVQHKKQVEVPLSLLESWLKIWAGENNVPGRLRVELLTSLAEPTELLLNVLDEQNQKIAYIQFRFLDVRGFPKTLQVVDHETDKPFRRKRLMSLIKVFLIHRTKAEAVHYVYPSDDNRKTATLMVASGIFKEGSLAEASDHMIAAAVNSERIQELVSNEASRLDFIKKATGNAVQPATPVSEAPPTDADNRSEVRAVATIPPQEATAGKPLAALNDETALQILTDYNRYGATFADLTRRAKFYFETMDWEDGQVNATARTRLYRPTLDDTQRKVTPLLDRKVKDIPHWETLRDHYYLPKLGQRYDADLALTFFYSVMRRPFFDDGVSISYDDDGINRASPIKGEVLYQTYPRDSSTANIIRSILKDIPWERAAYENVERDAEAAARVLDQRLKEIGLDSLGQVQILKPLFLRNKGAYVIGRIATDKGFVPLAFPLLNTEKGIIVDTDGVLTQEAQVANLFKSTRSDFFVDTPYYRELVEFLESILPSKGRAALYASIGLIHPAKIELIKEAKQHEKAGEKLEPAEGTEGTSMIVFGFENARYVYKVIVDHVGKETIADRQTLESNYRQVHEMDRVGRMLDPIAVRNMKFRKSSFFAGLSEKSELLEKLRNQAPDLIIEGVDEEGEFIVIRQLYIERKVTPLDVRLEELVSQIKAWKMELGQLEAEGKTEKMAKLQQQILGAEREIQRLLIDLGQAIKDLAAAGIWIGDTQTKNFGVTSTGEIVAYDFDEFGPLLTEERQNNFHFFKDASDYPFIPVDEDGDYRHSSTFQDKVVHKRVFLNAEFGWRQMGLPEEYKHFFYDRHRDLLTEEFWTTMQERLRNREVPDFFPYPKDDNALQPLRSELRTVLKAAEVIVAREMAAGIFGLGSRLAELMYASQLRRSENRISAEERERTIQDLVLSLESGGKGVFSAELIHALGEEGQKAYFDTIFKAHARSKVRLDQPLIHIVGSPETVAGIRAQFEEARKNLPLALRAVQPVKFETRNPNEVVIADRLSRSSKQNVAVATQLASLKGVKLERGVIPFLVEPEEIRELEDQAAKLLYVNRLTQFLLLASRLGPGEINAWVQQMGLNVKQGIPQLSFEVLISDKFAAALREKAVSQSA